MDGFARFRGNAIAGMITDRLTLRKCEKPMRQSKKGKAIVALSGIPGRHAGNETGDSKESCLFNEVWREKVPVRYRMEKGFGGQYWD